MSRPATARLKVNPPLGLRPSLENCRIFDLNIDPTYQRGIDNGHSQTLVRKIAMFWDWTLFHPLAAAKAECEQLAERIDQLDQLPVLALHPRIGEEYRDQVARLNEALAENPEARTEVIPRIRALIDSITIDPAEEGRGVTINVTGRLNAMLALASGQRSVPAMYGNVGAGEGAHALPQFLKAAV